MPTACRFWIKTLCNITNKKDTNNQAVEEQKEKVEWEEAKDMFEINRKQPIFIC